jgi:tellurite resistance protein TerC
MQGRFRYLNIGLGVILAFVGVKMLLSDVWHPPEWVGLAVIALTLSGTMALSAQADRRDAAGPA